MQMQQRRSKEGKERRDEKGKKMERSGKEREVMKK